MSLQIKTINMTDSSEKCTINRFDLSLKKDNNLYYISKGNLERIHRINDYSHLRACGWDLALVEESHCREIYNL